MESFQTIGTTEKSNELTYHGIPVTEKIPKLSALASGLVNELLPGMEFGPEDLMTLPWILTSLL